MKAVYLESKAGTDALVVGDLPRPRPGDDEALVKVQATAITPTEVEWYPTFTARSGQPRPFPIVLSHELSGIVESVGSSVRALKPGDAVYGLNDWFANGAQAEYCVAPAAALAHRPRSLDPIQAAVVPISALTAWQGLVEKSNVERGQRVLIHGASGGVGVFAVQLARSRGAHVVATASSANIDFVRSLGADQVIDYRTTRFEDVVRDVDVVFDAVGGETLERSWSVLAKGGKLVTVATQGGRVVDQRGRDAFLLVRADGAGLGEIARWIDAGKLRVFVEAVFPLSQAREAYTRARRGGLRGKIVLEIGAN